MVHFNNDPPRYSFSSLPPRYSQISFDEELQKSKERLKISSISNVTTCNSSCNSINRLEMQHHIFKYLWQSNYSTPIAKQLQAGGTKVLEIGLKPEIWTFDMANNYPSSTFIGLNNSTITCNNSCNNNNEPSNATVLRTDSSSSTIPFPDETFDFVYQRFFLPQLNTSSSLNSNSSFIEQYNLIKHMIRVLNPGGWVEFMIIDNLCWYNSGLFTFRLTQAYYSLINNGCEYSRIDEKHIYNMLISTKQVKSVFIKTKRTLLGANGGRIGELLCDVLLQPLKSNKSALCKYMRISSKEFDDMYNTMLQEINDYETFCISHRICAKKCDLPD